MAFEDKGEGGIPSRGVDGFPSNDGDFILMLKGATEEGVVADLDDVVTVSKAGGLGVAGDVVDGRATITES